mgnify:CR=1 FL=1
MFEILKNSTLVKKVLLSIFLGSQFFMLIGLSSVKDNTGIYIILITLFILTAILLNLLDMKRWIEFNRRSFKNYIKITLGLYFRKFQKTKSHDNR